MAKTSVLYHKGCSDGFGAAWSAWKKFGNKAEYLPVKFGEKYPDGLEGKDVYIMDFCYPMKETEQILKVAKSLTIIDHHFSRKNVIQSIPNHIYSEKNSGAMLAWKYFHPGKPVPKMIKYIEDIDLWHRKLPHTDELCVSLRSYDREFSLWNKIAKDLENSKTRKKYIDEGRVMLKVHEQVVSDAVRNSQIVTFMGHKAVASNSHVLASDISHALITHCKVPVAIVWYQQDDCIKVRLNSDDKVDVSKLAQNFGDGGGHKNSAAFRLKLGDKLPWKVISGKIS